MIEQLQEYLSLNWIGSTIGLVSILIALYLYAKSIKRPRLSLHIQAGRMISWGTLDEMPKGISVIFEGEQVPRICRSVVRIWNSGSATLDQSQMAPADPLRIKLSQSNSRFLFHSKIKENNPANNCQLEHSDQANELLVAFDYLDPGDGIAIGILHTDKSPKPEVHGSIKGSHMRMISGDPNALNRGISRSMPYVAKFIVGFGILLLTLSITIPQNKFTEAISKLSTQSDSPLVNQPLIFIGALYLILGAALMYGNRRKYPKSLTTFSKRAGKKDNPKGQEEESISTLE